MFFERSSKSRTRACPSLWLLALSFEHEQGDWNRLKSLVFRGIRACPWSKEMYMRVFQSLRGVMEEAELQELQELMQDKQVRARIG